MFSSARTARTIRSNSKGQIGSARRPASQILERFHSAQPTKRRLNDAPSTRRSHPRTRVSSRNGLSEGACPSLRSRLFQTTGRRDKVFSDSSGSFRTLSLKPRIRARPCCAVLAPRAPTATGSVTCGSSPDLRACRTRGSCPKCCGNGTRFPPRRLHRGNGSPPGSARSTRNPRRSSHSKLEPLDNGRRPRQCCMPRRR